MPPGPSIAEAKISSHLYECQNFIFAEAYMLPIFAKQ